MFSLNLKTAQTFFKLNNKTIKIKNFYNLVKSKTTFTKSNFFQQITKFFFFTQNALMAPIEYVHHSRITMSNIQIVILVTLIISAKNQVKLIGNTVVNVQDLRRFLLQLVCFTLSYLVCLMLTFLSPKIIFIILSMSVKI